MSTPAISAVPATASSPAAPAAPASTSAAMTATSTPAAPAATGGAPAPATTESVNPGAWMAGFNDDLKGYVSNKGFKDPAAVADAYRNLEKLQGVPQDRLLKLPESFYDDKGALTPEGRGIFERMGAPKDPKDYGIETPKEGGDAARLEGFLKAAHEMGLTKAQAQKLAQTDGAYLQSVMETQKAQAAQAFNDQQKALQTEWGAAYDSNRNIAADAARRMGMDAKKIDALSAALGHAETMKLLASIGKSVGESAFVQGQRANTPLEPASAKTRISELMADKDFGQRLMNGEADAKATWQRLHEQAYQGTVNI